MIFVAMTEDAIVFIEAPTYFDAARFAPAEVGAGDNPLVVEPARCDRKVVADVCLVWSGTDAGRNPDRRLMVSRKRAAIHGRQDWLMLEADRSRRAEEIAAEDRPPIEIVERTVMRKTVTVGTTPIGDVEPAEEVTKGLVVRLHKTPEELVLHQNLTSTQKRCNGLLDEARFARRERDAWFEVVLRFIGLSEAGRSSRLGTVVVDLLRERGRQDAKWGPIGAKVAPQNALAIPFGTGLEGSRELADEARSLCDAAFKRGYGTWADVLKEELAEALAETEPSKLRTELVQLAAVCVKCVEILDWKSGSTE